MSRILHARRAHLGALVFLLPCVFLLLWTPARAEQNHMVRVMMDTKPRFVELLRRHLDVAHVEPGEYVEIVAGPEEIDQLVADGYEVIVQTRDLASYYAGRSQAGFGGFKTYSEIVSYLNSIHSDHPSITTAPFTIGTSIEGREQWVIKVSDNPGTDEDEPEALFTGLHHAREPISAEVLLYTIDHLTDNYGSDPDVTDIVDGRELYFLPVVNPDGYVYNETTDPDGGGMWRKNRRDNGDGTYGVDLNRNYGYMWGYDNVGSSPVTGDADYRGTDAFSEPETDNVGSFVESRNFSIVMDYHSYSNLLLYPWGYDQIYTPDHLYFQAIADSATSFNGYDPGPGWHLYVTNGGSDDWEYGEQTTKDLIFAFTPEVGSSSDGFWPDPSRIVPLCQENLPVNMLMARIADNPRRLGPPSSPAMAVSSPVYAGDYTVEWTHSDSYNHASAFELVELSGKSTIVDDLESGPDLWTMEHFSSSSARAYSGSTSLYSGTGHNMEAYFRTVEDVEAGPADTVSLWCWYDIESNWDYAYVQVSTDGGSTFESLSGNITTDYNPYGTNRGNGITGNSGGWVLGVFPLDDYAGEQLCVQVLYATDQSVNGIGIYCDDIGPVDSFAETTVLSSSITGTSFEVSGRSPGTYYYKVRARDAEGQWSWWSPRASIVVNETPVPALSKLAALILALSVLAPAVYLLAGRGAKSGLGAQLRADKG